MVHFFAFSMIAFSSFALAEADSAAEAAFDSAMSDAAFRQKSSEECLQTFVDLAMKYPNSPKAAQTQQMIKTLQRNIAEERERPKTWLRGVLKLSKEDQIVDLIYRLRYCNDAHDRFAEYSSTVNQFLGHRMRYISMRRLFNGPDEVDKLAELGIDAVPRLIEALNDDTPTPFVRSENSKVSIPRVGDAAACALNAIAGKQLVAGPFVEDGKTGQAREKVLKWWKECQRVGDKQMLINGTEAGDGDSVFQAALLVKRYPETAAPAIRRALKKVDDPYDRKEIVMALKEVKGKDVDELLREQLRAKDVGARIAAADVLWERCRAREALQTMIKEWRTIAKRPEKVDYEESRHDNTMVWFLATAREPEAIREMAALLKATNHDLHNQILERVAQETNKMRSLSMAERSEMEKLLALGLSLAPDEDQFSRYGGGMSPADWATYGLGRLWRISPLLREDSSFRVRERQRAVIQNEWRRRQQLPPIPFTEFAQCAPVEKRGIEPLLREFISTQEDAERTKVASKILQLGAGTLPAIKDAIRNMNASNPARLNLEKLAANVSFGIADIRTLDGSRQISKELRQKLERWRGKAMTAKEFSQLIDDFCELTPAGTAGRLVIERPGDGTGAILLADWRDIDRRADPDKIMVRTAVVKTAGDWSSSEWRNALHADGGKSQSRAGGIAEGYAESLYRAPINKDTRLALFYFKRDAPPARSKID